MHGGGGRERDGTGQDTWHDCNSRCHQGFKSSCFKGIAPGDDIWYKKDPVGPHEYLSLQSYEWQTYSLPVLLNQVRLEW